jgi:hypothetical protein
VKLRHRELNEALKIEVFHMGQVKGGLMELSLDEMQELIAGLSTVISDYICIGEEAREDRLLDLKERLTSYKDTVQRIVPNPLFTISAEGQCLET